MAKRNPDGKKLCTTVRVLECDIDWPYTTEQEQQTTRETRARWMTLSKLIQQVSNCYYETWLVWHVQNNSVNQIKAWLQARENLRITLQAQQDPPVTPQEINTALKQTIGPCPVVALPDDLSVTSRPTSIYRRLTQNFPDITAHVVTVVIHLLQLRLMSSKAAHGSLPKWMAMLLHNERIPTFTEPLPIPFSEQDCQLVKEGSTYYIDVKLWRMPERTAKGTMRSRCVVDRIRLYTEGRKNQRQRTMLPKIYSNEWAFKGSSLVFHRRDKKWRVHIVFQRTTHVATIDGTGHAFLIAGHKNLFSIIYREDGQWRRWRVGGRGDYIHDIRRRIFLARATRNENQRRASNRKGRGDNNANRWRARSCETWRFFVKRVNHQISREVVDWCIARGFSSLTYKQPAGDYALSRYVSGDFKNSSWEFYQLGTFLSYKTQDAGIHCTIEKNEGYARDVSAEAAPAKAAKSAKRAVKSAQ